MYKEKFEKLKQNILRKKKLCKVLHISKVVGLILWVVWSIFLTIVLFVGLALGNEHAEKVEVLTLQEKPINNVARVDSTHCIAGVDEFCGAYPVNMMFTQLYEEFGYSYTPFNERWVQTTYFTSHVVYADNINTILDDGIVYAQWRNYDMYFLWFKQVGNQKNCYMARYMEFNKSTSTYPNEFIYLSTCFNFLYSGDISALDPTQYYTAANARQLISIKFEYAGYQTPDLHGFGHIYNQMVNRSGSYDEGYTNGYSSGYTTGYSQGYDDGQDSTPIVWDGSNPFKLIAMAFKSVGDVLNIDVLPNLKLGVLVFVPIIVSVIIVVVKMIRG